MNLPAILFVLALTASDLALYGLIYVAHAVVIKDFVLSEAALSGGYAVLGRIWLLQVPLQLVSLFGLMLSRPVFGFTSALTLVLISFVVPAVFYFGGFTTTIATFRPSLGWSLGEGFVLILSFSAAWLLLLPLRRHRVAA